MKKLVIFSIIVMLTSILRGEEPRISFFCELPEKEFADLLSDPVVISDLISMQASLRIGLHDFGNARTEVIKNLNRSGIPVYAWLLLPEEDGYWFNLSNGDKAIKRYNDFRKWTIENNLDWDGIGIDIEPDMDDSKLATSHILKFAWKAYKRLYNNKLVTEGQRTYQHLISEIKSDGYNVESYIIPYILAERKGGTKSLQKLLGIVDIKTDTEIPMLYTSLLDNPGIIPLYAKQNIPAALGSTGGGVVIEGTQLKAMSWNMLERDLLVASKLTDEVLIFCLETSVERGFLPKIRDLDFNMSAPDIQSDIQKQEKINKFIKTILIILDHPLILTIGVIMLIMAILTGIWKLVVHIGRIF